MSKIRLEKHHQLTLPADIVEQAHLQPGDVLEVTYYNNTIVLHASARVSSIGPQKDIMEYAGIGKGVWGKTTAEIDAKLAEDRASWER